MSFKWPNYLIKNLALGNFTFGNSAGNVKEKNDGMKSGLVEERAVIFNFFFLC